MSRVDEEDVTLYRHRSARAGLPFGFEKLGLDLDVLGQVFWGGTGTMRTRSNFRPRSLRNLRT